VPSCRKYSTARPTLPTATPSLAAYGYWWSAKESGHVALSVSRLRGYDRAGNHTASVASQTRIDHQGTSLGERGVGNVERQNVLELHQGIEAALLVVMILQLPNDLLIPAAVAGAEAMPSAFVAGNDLVLHCRSPVLRCQDYK
jgi:hypothetical protein